MKKASKLMCLLLALVLFFVACSSEEAAAPSSKPSENQSTASTQKEDSGNSSDEQAEGSQNTPADADLLSAPEKVLNDDKVKLDFHCTVSGAEEVSGNLTIVNNASPAIVYFFDGTDRTTYELSDAGELSKYVEAGDSGIETQVTDMTQEQIQEEVDMLFVYAACCGWKFTEFNQDIRFKKTTTPDDVNMFASAYTDENSLWYELVKNGETVGVVAVDPETGAFQYLQNDKIFCITSYVAAGDDVHFSR